MIVEAKTGSNGGRISWTDQPGFVPISPGSTRLCVHVVSCKMIRYHKLKFHQVIIQFKYISLIFWLQLLFDRFLLSNLIKIVTILPTKKNR